MGTPAHLIDNASEISSEWLNAANKIGITAGASAPEILVKEVVKQLQKWGMETVSEYTGIEEKVTFPIPRELQVS